VDIGYRKGSVVKVAIKGQTRYLVKGKRGTMVCCIVNKDIGRVSGRFENVGREWRNGLYGRRLEIMQER